MCCEVTGLLIDVSGSMNNRSRRRARPRGWMLPRVWLFFFVKGGGLQRGHVLRQVRHHSARRGFALRDGIVDSQAHSATYLKRALTTLWAEAAWKDVERLIVVTDEQSHDGILPA